MSSFQQTDLVRVIGRQDAGDYLYVVRRIDRDAFTEVERIDVHPLTPRLYTGRDAGPKEQKSLLPEELERLSTPAEALEQALPLQRDAWPTRTRHSIERAFGLWLLLEDRKRLLDAAAVDQLAHQISLLDYIKTRDLRRLLIADEVGLGKTIEAGLVMKWVLENNPSARVLYLAPAMLVDNVYGELKRMGVPARLDRYSSALSTVAASELDHAQVIIASIHKAAYEANIEHWRERSGMWDVLIVDECHHLSDWTGDGSNPQKQLRLVRDLVDKRLKPGGRLVLMSATPHQGNQNKFRNLLRLLSDDGYRKAPGDLSSVAGRVIYRTKEDVKDWDGKPLFSKRDVKAPTYVQLGPDYTSWLTEVAAVFQDTGAGPAAWRKAQALQWAASSPKAGLAYLTRLALRHGFDFEHDKILWDIARALLPYRHLGLGSPVEAVRSLLEKQAGSGAQKVDDEESDLDLEAESPVERAALQRALTSGLLLIGSKAMQTKLQPLLRWVTDEAPAKFVVFASPIETVDEIRIGLEHLLGEGAVVTITGSLKPYERRERMSSFRSEGVRALVASKAGSEGINLQVAHRLVHFDVPWNPMEMEQRVGRVHRYGSTRTVVVDTIVVEGSREERMLKRCRARLAQIVGALFGPEAQEGSRFEEMYSRVMTQVSAEELAEIVADEGFLTSAAERLDDLVQAGFNGWKASDEALRKTRDDAVNQIPDPGQTRPTDMESLFDVLGARPEPGWSHVRLVEHNGERIEEVVPASVWGFPAEGANVRRVADRITSLSLRSPSGSHATIERAGLNQPAIAAKLREIVGGAQTEMGRSPRAIGVFDGAGAVKLPEEDWARWRSSASLPPGTWETGAILLGWALRLLHRGTATEAWTSVRIHLSSPDQATSLWLSDVDAAELLRLLWRQRNNQNLILPPHKRADAAGFKLEGLADTARKVAPEILRGPGGFKSDKHDYEIVPIVALTIEPRRDVAPPAPPEPLDVENESFILLDSIYRPAADFQEKVAMAIADIPPVHSSGPVSVYVLLVVEPGCLTSSDPEDHQRAFGVYVGTTKQDLIARYRQHRDRNHLLRASSFNWNGVEPVGIVKLEEHFKNISEEDAAILEREVAVMFSCLGLRVFGGH